MPSTKTKKAACTVVLATGGKEYSATGNNFVEALSNLNPNVFKVKGVLMGKAGNMNSRILLRPIQMRRLGANQLMREIVAKRLATLLH